MTPNPTKSACHAAGAFLFAGADDPGGTLLRSHTGKDFRL